MSTVLFMCSGNFYRSRFAEHYFNHHAPQQGVAWRAISRGFRLHPNNIGPISPHAVTGLSQRGIAIDDPNRSPIVATEGDFQAAGLVIAVKEAEHRPMMRARFPHWADRIEYWHIHDIDVAEPTAALGELEQHVQGLIGRLRSS